MKKYYPFVISVSAFAITLFTFLYNEKFYFEQTFDATKFGTVISILGVILNSLTLYFLFIQIKEMRIARETTLQPLLLIEPVLVKIIINKWEKNNSPKNTNGELEDFRELRFAMKGEPNLESIPLQIRNVGLGVSIRISFNWEYDTAKVVKVLTNNYPNINAQQFSNTRVNSNNISLIYPNSSSIIQMPKDYIQLLNRKTFEEIKNYPLKLNITYQDISGKLFKQVFELGASNSNNEAQIQFIAL